MDMENVGLIVVVVLILAFLGYSLREAIKARSRNLHAAYTSLAKAVKHRELSAQATNAGDDVAEVRHASLADEYDQTANYYFRRSRPYRFDDGRLDRYVDYIAVLDA